MKRMPLLTLILLFSLACTLGEVASPKQAESPAQPLAPPTSEGQPTPSAGQKITMQTCRAWIRENHSLDYVNHGCEKHADILQNVDKIGGGVIPVGENRFFIVWFPKNWEQAADPEVVFTLSGRGGCSEINFDWWQAVAEEHEFAVIALQYAELDVGHTNPHNDYIFDDVRTVYGNLAAAYDAVRQHCPLENVPVVYHGFSLGSALSYQLALLDAGDEGLGIFDAYLADSGGAGPTGSGSNGKVPRYLQDAPEDAYHGAHFWLYCGMKDEDGVRCEDVEAIKELILAHGAVVDDFYVNPQGGHGIFFSVRRGEPPNEALRAMFEYVDAVQP